MERREEVLNYLYVWFKIEERREEILTAYMFGSEGRNSKINLPFYPSNVIVVYDFKTIFHIVK
jgi:hypothetical protein